MADETSTPQPHGGRAGGQREPGGHREPGGFRIRLSDNEMRAARTVQETFRLRSTVAVLGFAVRTIAQLIEEGKLDELVAEVRNQPQGREGARGTRRPAAGEGRGPRPERAPRVDPFARPSKPRPAVAPAEDGAAQDGAAEQGDTDQSPAPGEAPVGEAPADAAPAEDAAPADDTAKES
ncbi:MULTISPECIES: hypothetical protein [Aphanothece]|uniref:hypothetical protein n=1 Tax=Aphanothece TaxID=1121 RepID=UPI003984D9BF